MAKKVEHEEECDSDEDCEVYFLKPVNEYNIVEKIKEANKELFANETVLVLATYEADDDEGNGVQVGGNRKVTFAPNLEDYEPLSGGSDQSTATTSRTSGGEEGEAEPQEFMHLKMKSQDFEFSAIDEDDEEGEEEETATTTEHNQTGADVGEICDKIYVMDLETEDQERHATITTTTVQRRQIVKQDTFAYDVDDFDAATSTDIQAVDEQEIEELTIGVEGVEDEEESDNRSLTNLLPISDCDEDEVNASPLDYAADIYHEEYETVEDDDDDDDDDKLSIIVASYISSDGEQSAPSDERLHSATKRTKPGRILPFHKRILLRRRLNGNSIGAVCQGRSPKRQPPELTDLKLNYKTCCEYRNASNERLPRYTGYLSEYGLTREQLKQRAANQKRTQRDQLDQTLRAGEKELCKMQDNDRAFTRWLQRKMRFPINRTRNMFDAKTKIGGSGGATTAGNSKPK